MATAEVLFKIKTDVKDAIGNIDEVDKKAAGLAKTMAGIGLVKVGTDVLGGLVTDIYEVGSAAESSFAMVETLMTGTTKENKALKKEIKDLAAMYGVSGEAAAEAAYQALSAGVEQSKLAGFMENAFRTSIASGADMTTVVDAATTAINAYGLEGEAANAVFNTFVETQNAGKTTVEEFGSNLGKVAPLAATLGISIEQVAAATATMTANGISTSESMTMQKALFNELSSAGSQVATILKDKTGKSFEELIESGADLSDVIGIIQQAADEQGVSMNNLFGSVEAASGAMAIGGDNASTFKDNMSRLTDETYEADGAFDTMSGTAEHATSVIKEEFNAKLTDLYNIIMEKATPALNWLSENMDWLTPVIIGLTIAFGVFAIVLGIYAIAAGAAAIAQMALFWPILLVIAVIFILIAVIVLLVVKWDWIKEKTKAAWDSMIEAIKGAWTWIKDTFKKGLDWLKEKTKAAWDSMIEAIKGAWTWIKDTFKKGLDWIKEKTGAGWDWIKEKTRAVWDAVKNGIRNAWDNIKNGVARAIDWVVAKVQGFKDKITSLKNTIVNTFKNITSGIRSGIQGGIDTMINKVKSIANGFIGNVNGAIGTINKIPGVNIPKIPQLAIGTNMVGADGLAFLHKGEAVVPAANVEAGGFKAPSSWGDDNIAGQNITIESVQVSGVDDVQSLIDKVMDEVASKLKGAPKFRKV